LLPELDQGFPVTVDNKVIFKVSPFGSTALSPLARNLSVLFVSLTLILLVILITRWVKGVSVQRPFAGFLLLGALLISVRALMLAFRFPARFGRLMLFDPKDFASSQLNPSLGDMLINAILIFFLCFYLFRNYKRFKFFSHTPNWIVTVFGAVSVFFAILYPSIVIQTLYNNSAITLSISQSLTFDVVRVGAFLVLVISWISAFLFAHVAIRLLTVNDNLKQITVSVFIGFFVFLGLNEFTGQPYAEAAFVAIVFLIGVVAFRIYLSLDRFQYATFVYFFFAVLCFSVAGVFAVRNFENHRKAENQQRFAENFLVDRDYFGEYLMQETARKIEQDIFIQTRLTNPLVGKEAIKHKIQQVSLSGYFNRYNVLISLYDQTGDPLPDETDTTNFYTLVKRYDQKKFSTDYRNVFYITDREDRTLKKYIMLVPIRKGQAVVGNVLVELALKRIIPENVYPELLVDTRFQQAYRPRDQSYAIISSSQVEYSAGNFNYEPLIEAELANVDLYSEGIFRDGY
ncbi:MAG TPA: hypothetical protein PKX08_20715, partial [Cyclobacteriaceae bacterium]|nr:hypothetical protein [Cyclobacteriaceae bacterium]